jgi:hypothetical protein
MIYEVRLTLPKNTPTTALASTVVSIHPGTVKQVEIVLPKGCVGLVGIRVLYWEHQLWPSNPDSFFTGDDAHLVYPEELRIVDPPYEFTVEGYNLDDTFPHHPIFRAAVIPFGSDLKDVIKTLFTGATGPPQAPGGA